MLKFDSSEAKHLIKPFNIQQGACECTTESCTEQFACEEEGTDTDVGMFHSENSILKESI